MVVTRASIVYIEPLINLVKGLEHLELQNDHGHGVHSLTWPQSDHVKNVQGYRSGHVQVTRSYIVSHDLKELRVAMSYIISQGLRIVVYRKGCLWVMLEGSKSRACIIPVF